MQNNWQRQDCDPCVKRVPAQHYYLRQDGTQVYVKQGEPKVHVEECEKVYVKAPKQQIIVEQTKPEVCIKSKCATQCWGDDDDEDDDSCSSDNDDQSVCQNKVSKCKPCAIVRTRLVLVESNQQASFKICPIPCSDKCELVLALPRTRDVIVRAGATVTDPNATTSSIYVLGPILEQRPKTVASQQLPQYGVSSTTQLCSDLICANLQNTNAYSQNSNVAQGAYGQCYVPDLVNVYIVGLIVPPVRVDRSRALFSDSSLAQVSPVLPTFETQPTVQLTNTTALPVLAAGILPATSVVNTTAGELPELGLAFVPPSGNAISLQQIALGGSPLSGYLPVPNTQRPLINTTGSYNIQAFVGTNTIAIANALRLVPLSLQFSIYLVAVSSSGVSRILGTSNTTAGAVASIPNSIVYGVTAPVYINVPAAALNQGDQLYLALVQTVAAPPSDVNAIGIFQLGTRSITVFAN